MTRRGLAIIILGIGGAAVLGLFAAGHLGGLRLNLTPSYALGIWRIVPLDRETAIGDLVFICPPQTEAFALALERGYLRPGLCPGWCSPLIKTVVATPGKQVEIASAISIDGAPLAGSEVRETDAEGRALLPHVGGAVPPGHLFLHSEYAGSYDSRYFGPIPAAGLLGLARPVLTIDP
ncbi:conjugative transfer signal peptidase TraF [Chelativorans sp. ZYF759]|uniref:conjugative transfer signal peptidase TraF n=1 Tax=Chelativorans sp. ZYF759 TaxID=2692213 RepID=UPI00145CA012|nr:conjugative transfer signal peptidase TraF [Chelativorans sp. ZYF759]NMG41385.1 conjugative transfer signal peptidase TraF [Chelativorans sp. ZYF759]